MQKPSLVFLCQRIPYPPIKGERITSYNILRHLCQNYRVFLGTFVDDPADLAGVQALREMVEDLHYDLINKPWAYVKSIPRWLNGEPISFALFRSRNLSCWLDRIEAEHKPSVVFAHSSNISTYAVDKFKRNGNQEPKRILHFADVDSEKFKDYAGKSSGIKKWIFEIEARRVRREECRLSGLADTVAFVSDEEAEIFRSFIPQQSEHVVSLPNGVDTEIFDPSRYPESPFTSLGAAFIFTGAMDYLPNIDAVTWFAHEVFPGIKLRLPHAQFLIVGNKPTDKVKSLANISGIIVTGRVESVAAYLAHAQIAVAPLQIARGIQNKVLEAMAMAKPVVVSKEALTGISAETDKHVVCADDATQWITACIDLIQDKEKAYLIGQAARKLIFELYTWEAQFYRLDRMIYGK